MEFIHIKDGDYTNELWFEKLSNLKRKSTNGEEITVTRNNDGFDVALFEKGKFSEIIAIFNHIADAYDYARVYLINHKQTGFFDEQDKLNANVYVEDEELDLTEQGRGRS